MRPRMPPLVQVTSSVIAPGDVAITIGGVATYVSPDDSELLVMELIDALRASVSRLHRSLRSPQMDPGDASITAFAENAIQTQSAELACELMRGWVAQHAPFVDDVRRFAWTRGVGTGTVSEDRTAFTPRMSVESFGALAESLQRELDTVDRVRCRLALFVLALWPASVASPRTADPVVALDAFLRAADAAWVGWDSLPERLDAWRALAAERVEARALPWRASRGEWLLLSRDDRLAAFTERAFPEPREAPPGDAAGLDASRARLIEMLAHGQELLQSGLTLGLRARREAIERVEREVDELLTQVEALHCALSVGEAVLDDGACEPAAASHDVSEDVAPVEAVTSRLEADAQRDDDAAGVSNLVGIGDVEPEATGLPLEARTDEAAPRGEEPEARSAPSDDAGAESPHRSSVPPAADETLVEAGPETPRRPSEADRVDSVYSRFDLYLQRHAMDHAGVVVTAPWCGAGFGDALRGRLDSLLEADEPNIAELRIVSRALRALGSEDVIEDDDALSLWHLTAAAPRVERAVRAERLRRLRDAARAISLTPSSSWRWVVALEALASTTADPLDRKEIEDIHELVAFEAQPLRDVLTDLAAMTSQGESAVSAVRAAIANTEETFESAAANLAASRERFHDCVKRLWSACGGKVQRTHCREAWAHFINQVQPELQRLYPVDHGGVPALSSADEAAWIARLEKRHEKIADRGGARLTDRRTMDESASEIAASAREVIGDAERVEVVRSRREPSATMRRAIDHVRQLRALVEAGALYGVESRIARCVLGVIDAGDAARPKSRDVLREAEILLEDVFRRPAMVTALGLIGDAGDVSLAEVRDPLRAAAHLFDTPQEARGIDGMIKWAEAAGDITLVEPLLPRLDDAVRRRVRDARAAAGGRLLREVDEASALVSTLHALADPSASKWARVLIEVRQDIEAVGESPSPLAFWTSWLREVRRSLNADHDRALSALRAEADGIRDDRGGAARRALDDGRYAEAVRLVREGDAGDVGVEVRATRWRWQAAERWGNPQLVIEMSRGLDELRRRWSEGITGDHHKDQRLRTLFRDEFLRDLDAVSGSDAVMVECVRLRRWFAEQGVNPVALPQLADHGRLVLMTPAVPVARPELVQRVAEAVAGRKGDLVIVLTPRITPEGRARVLRELRSRHLRGAVLDDLDFCRLMEPGGVRPLGPLGILEVLLEQQRWSTVSPYQVAEGQNTRVEMYFGRALEAEQLWKQAAFSRVFSGRKLGKTALLRFIEQSQVERALPSGNQLRVVYVPAAGVDSERAMMERVLSSLAERLGEATWTSPRPEESPPEALERCIGERLACAPNESLLFFLDEADVWVEHELARYETARERSLSFVMRSRIEASRDVLGHPRARFVVSGYRVTSTQQGAWSNWGDVLRLKPLEAEDAVALITRPLARLGIDARRVARSLVFRCGYQPAVILRAGAVLVGRMEEKTGLDDRARRAVEVTDDVVDAVLGDDQVRGEILQVVRNNFQGNERGGAVFGALLQEMQSRPAWQPLDDAVSRVSERLRSIATDVDSIAIPVGGGTLEGEVRQRLQDLVDREIVSSLGRRDEYALRFPHLAPVLQPLTESAFVNEQLGRVRVGARAVTVEAWAALPIAEVEALRRVVCSAEADVPVAAPIVGTHWIAAMTDPRVGLADRLGKVRVEPVTAATLSGVIAAARLPGAVFVGDIDALRFALDPSTREGLEGDRYVIDERADERWVIDRVRWWFRRVRAYEFEAGDAVEVIYSMTRGIPCLLRLADTMLRGEFGVQDGETVDDVTWDRVRARLDHLAKDAATELAGASSAALTRRERQILAMICAATKTTVDGGRADRVVARDILADITEFWPLYREESRVDAEPVGHDEWWRVRLLQLSGVLPATACVGLPQERLCRVSADDPLRGMVAEWVAQRAL